MDSFRLDARTALISGAGRGIGRSCAVALAQAGAEVWLLARTREDIEQAADEIRAAGGKAHALPCDVLKIGELRAALAAMPQLDVFVNNAGSNIPEPFVEVSEEHLDRLLDLNVRAAFLAAQAAARTLRSRSASRCSSLTSTNGSGMLVPALLTKTSSEGSAAMAFLN